jgi:hypothetical protein
MLRGLIFRGVIGSLRVTALGTVSIIRWRMSPQVERKLVGSDMALIVEFPSADHRIFNVYSDQDIIGAHS